MDYTLISADLKKADTWQEVADIVERDSTRFAKAVKEWTAAEKSKLVNYLTNYLESDIDALVMHQIDWLSVVSLEKSLIQLSFRVRNILEGLASPWLNGCQFVKVEDFGKVSEEWTFFDPTSSKEIKVCDRADFQVIAF